MGLKSKRTIKPFSSGCISTTTLLSEIPRKNVLAAPTLLLRVENGEQKTFKLQRSIIHWGAFLTQTVIIVLRGLREAHKLSGLVWKMDWVFTSHFTGHSGRKATTADLSLTASLTLISRGQRRTSLSSIKDISWLVYFDSWCILVFKMEDFREKKNPS